MGEGGEGISGPGERIIGDVLKTGFIKVNKTSWLLLFLYLGDLFSNIKTEIKHEEIFRFYRISRTWHGLVQSG